MLGTMKAHLATLFALGLLSSCGSDCPDGGASGSVFCHAEQCADSETMCGGACSNPLTDRDNCGACGNACGDGFTCAGGDCVEACAGGLANCNGTCTDITSDTMNCGGCGGTYVCASGEACADSTCTCDAPKVSCADGCIDPQTDANHCGATGDCLGATAGEQCAADEGCLNGTCTSKKIYRGSLPSSTGKWMYNATPGLPGANAACEAHWPGSQVCTYDKLLAASQKIPAETLNATDFNGVAVTSWWIDQDVMGEGRCNDTGTANIPWSYETAHLNHVGRHSELTAGTGAVSAIVMENPGESSCNVARNVPCCSINTAP